MSITAQRHGKQQKHRKLFISKPWQVYGTGERSAHVLYLSRRINTTAFQVRHGNYSRKRERLHSVTVTKWNPQITSFCVFQTLGSVEKSRKARKETRRKKGKKEGRRESTTPAKPRKFGSCSDFCWFCVGSQIVALKQLNNMPWLNFIVLD